MKKAAKLEGKRGRGHRSKVFRIKLLCILTQTAKSKQKPISFHLCPTQSHTLLKIILEQFPNAL